MQFMFLYNKFGENIMIIFIKEPFRYVQTIKTLQPLLCQNRQLEASISPWLVFSNL